MEMLHSKFTFFKAGQGAFYGGQIFSPDTNRAWNFVYDCGTSPWIKGHTRSLNQEIDRFGEGYIKPVSEVDILFISHLDYDHVSGVINLLTKYTAKRIVIPYFPEYQRQFALVSSFDGEVDGGGDGAMNPDDYRRFIGNPYTFLNDRSDGAEIFIVLPDDKGGEYLSINDINPSDDGIDPVGTLASAPPELTGLAASTRYRFYRNNLQFFVQRRWEFTTYVKDIPTASFNGLKGCLNKELGKEEDAEMGTNEITELLTNHRKTAHACYKRHLSDVNAHGLVLLHGPVNFERARCQFFIESGINRAPRLFRVEEDWFKYPDVFIERRFGRTLLMGDTSINPQNNHITFPPQFKAKCQDVLVFQVPHHGSYKNWDVAAYHGIFDSTWDEPVFDVCNFGYGNTYGHPSHEVISALSHTIVLNSQFTSFSTELNVSYA